MNITLNTTTDIFYIQLLELFSNFTPINKLRKGDKLVLGEIMYRHSLYHPIKTHLRRNIIFSQDSKEEMCIKLKLSRAGFNNSLSALRRAKVLDKNNILIKTLDIFPKGEFNFNINFIIDEKKEETEDSRG